MMNNHFADVILPLALRGTFTYSIGNEFTGKVFPGMRVLVQVGSKKVYTGIICRIHDEPPALEKIRPITGILDDVPVADAIQIRLWQWISGYYMCTPGEVMKAALPSALFPEGMVAGTLREKYRPRKEAFVQIHTESAGDELNLIIDKLNRSPKQRHLFITYLKMSGYPGCSEKIPLKKELLLREADVSQAVLESLVRKKILVSLMLETSRLSNQENRRDPFSILSDPQKKALDKIRHLFSEKGIVLLHGVTSSGKTEIYIHLIEEQLKQGRQVLYLLPEIALTTQIINRLKKHFGDSTGVYHSRFSEAEKVEIRNKVASGDAGGGYGLVIGVRSALFLPFRKLGLVIIDEEQDPSYKQHDPAPRYHARDTAIVLAGLHGAHALLGSASPSVESYHNSVTGKYGLVELKERYGFVNLPEIILANTRESYRKKLMISHFTPELLEAMDEALNNKEQIILFQNRRGFAPYLECPECGWVPKCNQCSVNLTYHKGQNRLICHYCGYFQPLPAHCGNCNSPGLVTRGFGTEKIEDEIRIVFPKARVARLDQDTTKGRDAFNRIISAFEQNRTDILIGTQMISKGLDFENLTVVGVLNADNLLNFPDFRAHERSFHLLEQVSGRAGRRKKQGRVIIQTADPDNKIIRLVLNHDYNNLFRLQAEERQAFNYPPFCRMIRISLKHKDRAALNGFSDILGNDLKSVFGKRVLGPEYPLISRIQSWYIKTILIKLGRDKSAVNAKLVIAEAIARLEKEKGASSLRIAIDVDPY